MIQFKPPRWSLPARSVPRSRYSSVPGRLAKRLVDVEKARKEQSQEQDRPSPSGEHPQDGKQS